MKRLLRTMRAFAREMVPDFLLLGIAGAPIAWVLDWNMGAGLVGALAVYGLTMLVRNAWLSALDGWRGPRFYINNRIRHVPPEWWEGEERQ